MYGGYALRFSLCHPLGSMTFSEREFHEGGPLGKLVMSTLRVGGMGFALDFERAI